jgi:hypothetical protein
MIRKYTIAAIIMALLCTGLNSDTQGGFAIFQVHAPTSGFLLDGIGGFLLDGTGGKLRDQ